MGALVVDYAPLIHLDQSPLLQEAGQTMLSHIVSNTRS